MGITLSFPDLTPDTPLAVYETEVGPLMTRTVGLLQSMRMKLTAPKHTPTSVIYAGTARGEGHVEIFKHSSSFRWRRDPAPWRPSLENCMVDGTEAKNIAEAFLIGHGHWRGPPTRVDVSRSSVTTAGQDGGTWKPEAIVTYTFSVGGARIAGPGYRTAVTIDARGDVAEMYHFERSLRAPVLVAGQRLLARGALSNWAGMLPESYDAAVNEDLVYLAGPPRLPQPYLVPFYAYRWTSSGDLRVQPVAAVRVGVVPGGIRLDPFEKSVLTI
jgi:hypothetical protein